MKIRVALLTLLVASGCGQRGGTYGVLHDAGLSADGKTLLVLACNPHNQGVDQVRVRRPGSAEEYGFELAGDFPVIKRFPVTRP